MGGSWGCPPLFPPSQSSARPQEEPGGKERLDKSSPLCSTKLINQQHWAVIIISLKTSRAAIDKKKKSPLVGAGIWCPNDCFCSMPGGGKSSAGGGKRDLIIELHCDFAHIAGCCNQVTSVSDFLPSPPSSSSFFSFLFFSSPFFLSVVQISCLCLGVAETRCYLAPLKILIKGTMSPKSLCSSRTEKANGSQLRQHPLSCARHSHPTVPGLPSHRRSEGGAHRHLPRSTVPAKYLHIHDSLNKWTLLKMRRSPIYLRCGGRRKREEKTAFLKATSRFFSLRQVMPRSDWGLLLGSFRNPLLSM